MWPTMLSRSCKGEDFELGIGELTERERNLSLISRPSNIKSDTYVDIEITKTESGFVSFKYSIHVRHNRPSNSSALGGGPNTPKSRKSRTAVRQKILCRLKGLAVSSYRNVEERYTDHSL